MKDIKSWCRIICITVIASGVLLSIIPESKLKKTYKGFVSLLIIFVFINPLSGLKGSGGLLGDFSYKGGVSEDELKSDSTSVVIDCAENLLNERLDDILNEADIDASCKTQIVEKDSEVYIGKIEIYGGLTDEETDKVIAMLAEVTGGDTEIEFIR